MRCEGRHAKFHCFQLSAEHPLAQVRSMRKQPPGLPSRQDSSDSAVGLSSMFCLINWISLLFSSDLDGGWMLAGPWLVRGSGGFCCLFCNFSCLLRVCVSAAGDPARSFPPLRAGLPTHWQKDFLVQDGGFIINMNRKAIDIFFLFTAGMM